MLLKSYYDKIEDLIFPYKAAKSYQNVTVGYRSKTKSYEIFTYKNGVVYLDKQFDDFRFIMLNFKVEYGGVKAIIYDDKLFIFTLYVSSDYVSPRIIFTNALIYEKNKSTIVNLTYEIYIASEIEKLFSNDSMNPIMFRICQFYFANSI